MTSIYHPICVQDARAWLLSQVCRDCWNKAVTRAGTTDRPGEIRNELMGEASSYEYRNPAP